MRYIGKPTNLNDAMSLHIDEVSAHVKWCSEQKARLDDEYAKARMAMESFGALCYKKLADWALSEDASMMAATGYVFGDGTAPILNPMDTVAKARYILEDDSTDAVGDPTGTLKQDEIVAYHNLKRSMRAARDTAARAQKDWARAVRHRDAVIDTYNLLYLMKDESLAIWRDP